MSFVKGRAPGKINKYFYSIGIAMYAHKAVQKIAKIYSFIRVEEEITRAGTSSFMAKTGLQS
jgi:hypothetical protein